MGFKNYLDSTLSGFNEGGVRSGVKIAGRNLLFGAYHNLPVSYGTPIFGREWDALIILDACRPDLLAEVTDEYEFLPAEIETTYSVGSRSDTWMRRNFTSEYRGKLAQTAYVTGNPYSDSVCEEAEFAYLDEVWRYAWDDDVGSVSAEDITDRAIATGREQEFERLIVHYMQPHFPSYPDPVGDGIDINSFATEWNSVWDQLEEDEVSRNTVWSSYLENLEYVLDSVEILLRNFDGERAVISADHGNALGEWGLYGHPINKPAPVLRRVPWVSVTAEDTQERSPKLDTPSGDGRSDVKRRLEDLGYIS